jgi:hypothetical protein
MLFADHGSTQRILLAQLTSVPTVELQMFWTSISSTAEQLC